VDYAPPPVAPVAIPTVRVLPGVELSVTRRTARLLTGIGRIGAVALPAQAVLASFSPSDDPTVFAATALVTVIWAVALHSAFAAGRLSPLALGVWVSSAVGVLAGGAVVSAANFWLPGLRLSPLELLLMAVGVYVVSTSFEGIVTRSLAFRRRVLVIGADSGGSELVEELTIDPDSAFECIGVVDDSRETASLAGAPVVGGMRELPDIVRRERPDLVVLAGAQRAEAFDHLLDAAGAGFRVVGLPEFYEHAFGRVPVRHLPATWFMSVLHLYQRPYPRLTKRALDVALAGGMLIFAAPLLPVLAWLVRRSGPGPIVFRQQRLGEGGQPFEVLKFRTMVQNAEEPGKAIWAAQHDPRITRTGKLMRRTRLDELPQLWNVLRGDMSMIGPRPERPEFVDLLTAEVPFWTRRHLVKPGLTGWAQVRRGYTDDAEGTADKLSYDLYYLKHRSLILDLAIIAKTAGIAFTGSGAR